MNIYEEAVKQFGEDAQLDMAIEECAELIKAICKYRNRNGPVEDVIEEAVDVHLMVLQLCYLFGEPRFEKYLNLKTEKLVSLLNLGFGE